MSARDILKNFKSLVKKYARRYKIEIEGIQAPYFIEERHALISSLTEAMRKFKVRPVISGSEGATVITLFQHKNIPAVATGFGSGGCAHMSNEYVRIENLYKGALVLEQFLESYRF